MTATLLSSRQREILEAMADGARLRWDWVGDWRYVLDGKPVDGRSVYRLIRRGLVTWRSVPDWGLLMTDAGRRAVRP